MIQAPVNPQVTNWFFSPLDAVLVGMINSSSWLYSKKIDADRLQKSLAALLCYYPVFAGRITTPDTITTNNAGIAFEVCEQLQLDYQTLVEKVFLPDTLKAAFSIRKCKKGTFPIMSIKVTYITGGTVISIAVNHVCADGASLYRFVSDWSKMYNEESVTPVIFNQDLFPKPQHTPAELHQILEQKKWYKISLKNLLPMLRDNICCQKKIAPPLFISLSLIQRIRENHAIGNNVTNHAIICALLSHFLCKNSESSSVVSVVNLRGRAIYPENFIGNAVMNLVSNSFLRESSLAEKSILIQNNLKDSLQKDTIAAQFQLYTEAMTLKAPFLPFELTGTYGKKISCLLVNNFCSFHLYDICFGTAVPERVYPNELPDKIKIWPGNQQENGIYLFLRGDLSLLSSTLDFASLITT